MNYRLNRLFNAKSNHVVDVAIDNGFFNERSFLQGIESLEKSVRPLVAAAPDAIQLTIGQANYLQSLPGKEKPALVQRIVEAYDQYAEKQAPELRAARRRS